MAATPGLSLFDSTLWAWGTSTRTVTASTTKAAGILMAPKAGNISHVGFPVSANSGAINLDVRLETVATLVPTGILFGTNSNITAAPTVNNAFTWYALTTPAAVVAGDVFAAVLGYISGTSATVVYSARNLENGEQIFPYAAVMGAGTWGTDTHNPIICVKYDDGTIIRGSVPCSQHTSSSYGTGSSPNERATVFTPPFTCTLESVRVAVNVQATSAFTINLYQGTSTTPVSGGTITVAAGKVVNGSPGLTTHSFATAPSLTANQQYRLSVLPTVAATLQLFRYVFPSTAERDATLGAMTSDTRAGSSWIGESTVTSEMIFPVFGSVTASSQHAHAF